MKVFHVQILGCHYYVSAEAKDAIVKLIDGLKEDANDEFNSGVDNRLADADYTVTEMHICDTDCFVHEWL